MGEDEGIKFYSKNHEEISHDDSDLLEKAVYVWDLFEEQKNFLKLLYPVFCFVHVIQRVCKFIVGTNNNIPLFSINCKSFNFIINITPGNSNVKCVVLVEARRFSVSMQPKLEKIASNPAQL